MAKQKSNSVSNAHRDTKTGDWTERIPRTLGYADKTDVIDLDHATATDILTKFDVRELAHAALTLVSKGAWGAAVVELMWSINGMEFYSFAPAVEFIATPGTLTEQDVKSLAWLGLAVTTPNGAALDANVNWFGDSSEFA